MANLTGEGRDSSGVDERVWGLAYRLRDSGAVILTGLINIDDPNLLIELEKDQIFIESLNRIYSDQPPHEMTMSTEELEALARLRERWPSTEDKMWQELYGG